MCLPDAELIKAEAPDVRRLSGRGIGSKRHPVRKGDRAADNHQEVTVGLPERAKGCQVSRAR
ncbi:hypothetical protein NBRC3257_1382 [Gluconobacter thailandicus NBRC 3257]|uniref:Transposase n=1 Tax=Gluconobacter thailandicus NBRC 3257 TaxID=1381097 RepID=A0ABQ0IVY4_GLUTH|nr:hypothetical protein NBRC3257_1382 [Gluconobacter thailandicus NBRC 3257]